jgi:hypothetical protein
MKFIIEDSLKDSILNTINDEEIFSRYLSISEPEIQECISTNRKIRNPLRKDEHPSLGFKEYWSNGRRRVWMRDFADDYFDGDCFQLVGICIGRDCNNKKGFIDICRHILNHVHTDYTVNNSSLLKRANTIRKYDIEYKDFEYSELRYWNQYGITKEGLRQYKVFSVYSINEGNNRVYSYKKSDTCYGYYLGKDSETGTILWKFYFPNRNKDNILPRFITNNKYNVEALYELKPNDYLLLTKSRKDCLCLRNLLASSGKPNVSVTNVNGEGAKLNDFQVSTFKSMYPKGIFTFMDFDWQGVKCMGFHKRTYDIKPLLLTRGRFGSIEYGAKDFSDYIANNGVKEATKLIESCYVRWK